MARKTEGAKNTEVKNAIARAIEGTGDTVKETIDVPKGATVSALRSVGNVGEATAKAGADILTGAIETADDVGGEAWHSSSGNPLMGGAGRGTKFGLT